MADPSATLGFFVTYMPNGTAVIAAVVAFISAVLNVLNSRQSTRIAKLNSDRTIDVARINADQAVRVSHGAKLSEFREKWLGELRRDIADFIGAAEMVLNMGASQ
jgi:hypothetical protein